jgi:hypothetical protein
MAKNIINTKRILKLEEDERFFVMNLLDRFLSSTDGTQSHVVLRETLESGKYLIDKIKTKTSKK